MDCFLLKDLDVSDKRVLLRADFNVPIKDGKIVDDTRIRMALPTIEYLLRKKASVIIMSHLGRPKGKVVAELSLLPVAKRLSNLLGVKVGLVKGFEILDGFDVCLLENLRFDPREKEGDLGLAKKLAGLADVYVNDAFGTAHRKDASVYGVPKYLPSAMGLLVEKEIDNIMGKVENPKRPFVAIIGGAKISDKIGVVDNLLKRADKVLIGGAMIFTFYKALGYPVGKSLCEDDMVCVARKILRKGKDKIVLPVDVVVSSKFEKAENVRTVSFDSIPKGYFGLDIGRKSIEEFSSIVLKAKTIAWNGPMGEFEVSPFDKGTNLVAKAVAESGGFSIVGGGDSVSAVVRSGFEKKINHISTGGGASLVLFEGKELAGILALKRSYRKFGVGG